jgi:UDP-glucose 4-epimerase
VSLLDAIGVAERIAGRKANLRRFDRQRGDVRHTRARLDLARNNLGYAPRISLEQGLTQQWNWISKLYG